MGRGAFRGLRRDAAAGGSAANNILGILNSLVSGAAFQGANGLVRYLSAEFHAFELVFFRNFFAVILLLPLIVRTRARALYTRRFPLHFARAVLNFIAMYFMFTALALDPIATVIALAFTTPLFVTLGAALFLGERIHLRRLAAIAVGFIGMLIIIRPGFGEMTPGMPYTLAYVVIWAAGLLLVKLLARTESSVTQTVYAAMLQAPMALIGAVFFWRWPEWWHLAWFFALAACGSIAQLTLSQAFRHADAGLVLSVDYAKLIWAALIGYVFFAEVPGVWTWVGAAVICASVYYISHRERLALKRQAGGGK